MKNVEYRMYNCEFKPEAYQPSAEVIGVWNNVVAKLVWRKELVWGLLRNIKIPRKDGKTGMEQGFVNVECTI